MSLEPLPLPTREELRALKSALVPEAQARLRLALGAGAVALRHLEAILLSLATTHPGSVSARLSLAVDAAEDLVRLVEKLKTRAAKLRR